MNLFQKLVEVRKCVKHLQKKQPSFKGPYVTGSQILDAIRPTMDELGVMMFTNIDNMSVTRQENKGKFEYWTELRMTFTFINADNPEEHISKQWFAQGLNEKEQGIGKALTYAERYFLLKTLSIATDENDPDSINKGDADELPESVQQEPKKLHTPQAKQEVQGSNRSKTDPGKQQNFVNNRVSETDGKVSAATIGPGVRHISEISSKMVDNAAKFRDGNKELEADAVIDKVVETIKEVMGEDQIEVGIRKVLDTPGCANLDQINKMLYAFQKMNVSKETIGSLVHLEACSEADFKLLRELHTTCKNNPGNEQSIICEALDPSIIEARSEKLGLPIANTWLQFSKYQTGERI